MTMQTNKMCEREGQEWDLMEEFGFGELEEEERTGKKLRGKRVQCHGIQGEELISKRKQSLGRRGGKLRKTTEERPKVYD